MREYFDNLTNRASEDFSNGYLCIDGLFRKKVGSGLVGLCERIVPHVFCFGMCVEFDSSCSQEVLMATIRRKTYSCDVL